MRQCPFCAEEIPAFAIVCRSCDRESPRARRLARLLRAGEIMVGSGAILLVAYLLIARIGALPFPRWFDTAADSVLPGVAPPPPLVLSLLDSATLRIPAGAHFDTTFVVNDPRSCHVTGRIRGLAGGDRDVEVYLLDPEAHANWRDGIHPAALFESGRAASTTLSVPLPGPGTYTLLLSNRYSIFFGKRVLVEDARVTCG